MNMKLFFALFTLSFLVLTSCNKTKPKTDGPIEVSSSCEITEAIMADHYESARILYTRLVRSDDEHEEYNADTVSSTGIVNILERLAAIETAAAESPEIAVFTTEMNISATEGWSPSELILSFPDEASMEDLKTSLGTSGYEVLDRLVNDYDFEIGDEWDIIDAFTLEGTYSMNIEAIVSGLNAELPEGISADYNFYFGDSGDITYTAFADYDEFVFSHGWGDCPSGCIHRHYWKVTVDEDCVVSLVEEWGDDLP